MNPVLTAFAARNLIEAAKKRAGIIEPAVEATRFAGDNGYRLEGLPVLKNKRQRKRVATDAPNDGVVLHVTDVRGGYGSNRWGDNSAKQWTERLRTQRVDPRILSQLEAAGLYGSNGADLVALGKQLSRWTRLLSAGYHSIGSKGDVLSCHGSEWRTAHAGPYGNHLDGVGFDCHHTEDFSPSDATTFRATLYSRVRSRAAEGLDSTAIRYHRFCDPARRVDTSRIIHQCVTLPAVAVMQAAPETFGRVWIDYEARAHKGLPIPRSWDDNALFDDKGKRL